LRSDGASGVASTSSTSAKLVGSSSRTAHVTNCCATDPFRRDPRMSVLWMGPRGRHTLSGSSVGNTAGCPGVIEAGLAQTTAMSSMCSAPRLLLASRAHVRAMRLRPGIEWESYPAPAACEGSLKRPCWCLGDAQLVTNGAPRRTMHDRVVGAIDAAEFRLRPADQRAAAHAFAVIGSAGHHRSTLRITSAC